MLRSHLDIDDSAEFLDAVEKQIPLFNGVLILLILAVGPIRLDDTVDLVDFGVETASSDKSGEKILEKSASKPAKVQIANRIHHYSAQI